MIHGKCLKAINAACRMVDRQQPLDCQLSNKFLPSVDLVIVLKLAFNLH